MSKRNHVASDIKPQGNDESPLVVILIFNVLVLIVLWFILLVPTVNDVFVTLWKKFSSCPPSTFQTLGVALIILTVLHLIWRFFGEKLIELMKEAGGPVIGAIIQLLLGIVRLLQPPVGGHALWALLGVALVIALALVGLPRPIGVPILLSGFTVQRTTPPPIDIHPGDTLLVAPGEIVHISANFLGPSVFKCTWFINVGTRLGIAGCSLTYCAPRQDANWGNVAVHVSSPCRTDPEVFAGFHIRVAQTTP